MPILVIVFALWETTYSKEILVAIGVIMILCIFFCKGSCSSRNMMSKNNSVAKVKTKATPRKPLKKRR